MAEKSHLTLQIEETHLKVSFIHKMLWDFSVVIVLNENHFTTDTVKK